jgi:hypothetical protein
MAYMLRQDVHAYVDADAAILLDLAQDVYVGLDARQARALEMVVVGWPKRGQEEQVDEAEALKLAEHLVGRGLLTLDQGKARVPTLSVVPPVEHAMVYRYELDQPQVTPDHVLRFLRACAIAVILSRVHSFRRIIHAIQRDALDHRTAVSHATVRELTQIFYWLRPFAYAKSQRDLKGRCLFDSLVLFKFLSAYGVYPSWVIGVRTRPFAAHSWLQIDNYVLNGTPEYVSSFKPILAI